MRISDLKNRLTGSREAKRLVSNFIALGLLQVAGYIFPLLTVPYLAHVIGVDRYGEIAFAYAVMIYFQALVDYGFVFSTVRDIARCRENKEQVSDIYSTVMWSRFLLVGAAFILLTFLILLVPKFAEMRYILYASFLMVVGHALFPDWMFQAIEKMKYITIFNVLVKFLFTVAVFTFIKCPDDYILQPILTSMGYIICGIGAMYVINKWGIKLRPVGLRKAYEAIKSNFDLFINQLIPNLYNSASVLYLGFTYGDAANGVYDAANRFNTAGASFFSIISRTFYPFLSRRLDKHAFFTRLNLLASGTMALLLFVLAPFIIRTFFPSDFDGAITALRILSVSLIFLAMCNIYGTNFLILKGYERAARQITLYSSIIGLLFGVFAVYQWSYIGVALTVAFSRGVMGFWNMYMARQIMKQT